MDILIFKSFLPETFLSLAILFQLVYNVKIIIEVFNKLCLKYNNIFLSIIGRGKLSNQVKDLSILNKNIDYIGFVNRDKLVKILLQTDVVISYPSVDNQPMSILEGIATNNLIVTSDVGGVRDLIPNEDYGVLVESENSKNLEVKLNKTTYKTK
jgi:glycosyltransferase involved in cell wall biosynthesis